MMRLTLMPPGELPPRYNVAPTQLAPVVRQGPGGERTGSLLRWGLVPSWSKGPGTLKSDLINARAENVATSPAFKHALRQRRALVPVSGFYEWQVVPGARVKRPHLVRPAGGGIFALAGLWERWTPEEGAPLESFTIITTAANEVMAPIHNRMPAIIAERDWDRWLDPKTDAAALRDLLQPPPAEGIAAAPVSTRINNPRHDDASLIEPLERSTGAAEADDRG